MLLLDSVAAATDQGFELGSSVQGEKAFLRSVPASHPLLADALLYRHQQWRAEHDDAPQFLQCGSRIHTRQMQQ